MAHVCKGHLKGLAVKLLQPSRHQAAIAVCGSQQVANLTSISDTPAEGKQSRGKPWPYEKYPYNFFFQFIDHTTKRFDDNSKVIVVDGNLGTGKTELAEKIAKEFGMKFFPDVTDKDVFEADSGFDIREVMEELPLSARHCDMESFYLQNLPKVQLARFGNTQFQLYHRRYFRYLHALTHLLNTGQGVVLERGVWGDMVFVETMRRMKHLSLEGYRFLKMVRLNTICQLWKPHAMIYLDAPVDYIREQINKRNIPFEMKSPVLNDQFITEMRKIYKEQHMKEMKKSGEVLEYDVTDMPDWDMIVEDLERLNLEKVDDPDSDIFADWQHRLEDDWNGYRMDVSNITAQSNFFSLAMPWKAPEMYWTGDDARAIENVIQSHPKVEYNAKYDANKLSHLLQW